MAAQLEITLTKADSEQLARSIAEEQYSDLEKEKIMKELEIKEMMARHKQELTEKDATIASVSNLHNNFCSCFFVCARNSLFLTNSNMYFKYVYRNTQLELFLVLRRVRSKLYMNTVAGEGVKPLHAFLCLNEVLKS